MNWPTPLDYQEAVQNPYISFSHPDLKGGQASRNKLGLPQVSSGNFACVFKIPNGRDACAVRCFLRPVADQERRYDLLSQHFQTFSSPNLVEFEYIVNGIRVRGQWFPVVKMEWVEGETLDNFIQQHLNDSDVLGQLAAKWRALVAGLRGAYMAHGDLQHGNVLVDENNRMRLVDYDAMFIPVFRGEKSPELGYPDYQHPHRSADKYDESLDNFAALVIYLSLLAIRAEPILWDNFHTGDNLILTKEDYLNSKQSLCFKRLKGSQDPAVRKLAAYLEDSCSKPLTQMLDLESALQNVQISPISGRQAPANTGRVRAPVRATATQKGVPSPLQKATVPFAPPKAAHRVKVKCPRCGYLNEPHYIYCQNPSGCEAVLHGYRRCSSCHKVIPVNAFYCPECGTKQ